MLRNTNIFSGVGFLALKQYIAGGVCTSKKRLSGKTVIITGANCGIGKETAKDLVKRGEIQDSRFYIVQRLLITSNVNLYVKRILHPNSRRAIDTYQYLHH